jgi:hypothetical protein
MEVGRLVITSWVAAVYWAFVIIYYQSSRNRRRYLGIEADEIAPHPYVRKRDGESITRRKYFCWQGITYQWRPPGIFTHHAW